MSQKPRKKQFRKRHPPVGAKPGTLMISSAAKPPDIFIFEYNAKELKEHHATTAEQVRARLPAPLGTAPGSEDAKFWIDIQGVGNERVLKDLAAIFHIHPLALEDVVNVPSRPKAEPHEHHLLIVSLDVARVRAN
jgi:magnesium transporter